jgi:hypothetical protein
MASHYGKPVGTVRTIGRIADRMVALAVLRREVAAGDVVQVGGVAADVVELPFEGLERTVA